MTEEQVTKYAKECYVRLQEKQLELKETYALDNYDSRVYEDSKLLFKKGHDVAFEFNVQEIGTWFGGRDQSVWSWNSEIKSRLNEVPGVCVSDSFDCDVLRAYELASMIVEHIGAKGIGLHRRGNSSIFLAMLEPVPTSISNATC